MDEEHEAALRKTPALAPACSAGCAHCCHVHAYATAPEVFAVANHLRKTLSPKMLQSLRAQLEARAREVASLSDEVRWAEKIPCALLDARGFCSVYEARPLRCRAFHSLSADVCRDAFEGRDDVAPLTAPLLDRAANAVEEGYDHALASAGLSAEGYRLEIALAAALADLGAPGRWLAGEPIFESARGATNDAAPEG